jgi:uncharacterized protein YkwD
MSASAKALVLAIIVLALCNTASAADPLLAPTTACRPGAPTEMLCLVNWARKQSGLQPLVRTLRVVDSAQRKANAIVACQEYRHDPCGNLGVIPGGSWGENIVWGRTIRESMDAWLLSPGHRANILNPVYSEYGGAFRLTGPFPRLWVNQFFAPAVQLRG